MAIDTLRATQILSGADALLPSHTDAIAPAAGSIATDGILGPLSGTATSDDNVSDTPLAAAANNAIDNLHYSLEGASDSSGLAGSVHGVTNLGETIGLGKVGQGNLVTDAVDTPVALLSGDTSTVTHVPSDVGNIATAAQGLVSGAASDLAAGTFLSDPVQNAASFASTLSQLPVSSIADGAVQAVDMTADGALGSALPATLGGLLGVADSAGLGTLGGSNLLSDTLATPTGLLSGDTTPLSHLAGDVGTVGSALAAIPGAIGTDVGDSGLLAALTSPSGNVVSTAASTASGLVGGATDALGLGVLGQTLDGALGGAQSGPLQGVGQLPSDLLGGTTQGLSPLPAEIGTTVGSLGPIVGTVASEASDVLGAANLGGAASPVASMLAGPVATVGQVVGDAAGTAVNTAAGLVAPITSSPVVGTGTDGLAHALDGANDAVGTVVSTASSLPGSTSGLASGIADAATHLAGDAAGAVGPTVADVTSTAADLGSGVVGTATTLAGDATSAAVSTAADAATAATGVGAGLVGTGTGLAGDAVSAASPIVSNVVGTGNGLLDTATHTAGDVASTAGSTASGLASSATGQLGGVAGGSGAHDIVTISVGPQTPTSGLGVNVLSSGGSITHPVDVHVGNAGAPVPTVANVAILPDSIHVPSAGGGGLDALSGLASTVAPTSAAATGSAASATHGLDLGLAHVDVPVAAAHADPLHGLAHPA